MTDDKLIEYKLLKAREQQETRDRSKQKDNSDSFAKEWRRRR